MCFELLPPRARGLAFRVVDSRRGNGYVQVGGCAAGFPRAEIIAAEQGSEDIRDAGIVRHEDIGSATVVSYEDAEHYYTFGMYSRLADVGGQIFLLHSADQ